HRRSWTVIDPIVHPPRGVASRNLDPEARSAISPGLHSHVHAIGTTIPSVDEPQNNGGQAGPPGLSCSRHRGGRAGVPGMPGIPSGAGTKGIRVAPATDASRGEARAVSPKPR